MRSYQQQATNATFRFPSCTSHHLPLVHNDGGGSRHHRNVSCVWRSSACAVRRTIPFLELLGGGGAPTAFGEVRRSFHSSCSIPLEVVLNRLATATGAIQRPLDVPHSSSSSFSSSLVGSSMVGSAAMNLLPGGPIVASAHLAETLNGSCDNNKVVALRTTSRDIHENLAVEESLLRAALLTAGSTDIYRQISPINCLWSRRREPDAAISSSTSRSSTHEEEEARREQEVPRACFSSSFSVERTASLPSSSGALPLIPPPSSLAAGSDEGEGPFLVVLSYINNPCVVIGRNQSLFREANLPYATQQQVPIVRRSSGGGAVFHDRGNVNFSFLTHRSRYSPSSTIRLLMNYVELLVAGDGKGHGVLRQPEEAVMGPGAVMDHERPSSWFHWTTAVAESPPQPAPPVVVATANARKKGTCAKRGASPAKKKETGTKRSPATALVMTTTETTRLQVTGIATAVSQPIDEVFATWLKKMATTKKRNPPPPPPDAASANTRITEGEDDDLSFDAEASRMTLQLVELYEQWLLASSSSSSSSVAGYHDDPSSLSLTTTDRHDIFLNGKKITGSAMRLQREAGMHHCTLLVSSDFPHGFLRSSKPLLRDLLLERTTTSLSSSASSTAMQVQSTSPSSNSTSSGERTDDWDGWWSYETDAISSVRSPVTTLLDERGPMLLLRRLWEQQHMQQEREVLGAATGGGGGELFSSCCLLEIEEVARHSPSGNGTASKRNVTATATTSQRETKKKTKKMTAASTTAQEEKEGTQTVSGFSTVDDWVDSATTKQTIDEAMWRRWKAFLKTACVLPECPELQRGSTITTLSSCHVSLPQCPRELLASLVQLGALSYCSSLRATTALRPQPPLPPIVNVEVPSFRFWAMPSTFPLAAGEKEGNNNNINNDKKESVLTACLPFVEMAKRLPPRPSSGASASSSATTVVRQPPPPRRSHNEMAYIDELVLQLASPASRARRCLFLRNSLLSASSSTSSSSSCDVEANRTDLASLSSPPSTATLCAVPYDSVVPNGGLAHHLATAAAYLYNMPRLRCTVAVPLSSLIARLQKQQQHHAGEGPQLLRHTDEDRSSRDSFVMIITTTISSGGRITAMEAKALLPEQEAAALLLAAETSSKLSKPQSDPSSSSPSPLPVVEGVLSKLNLLLEWFVVNRNATIHSPDYLLGVGHLHHPPQATPLSQWFAQETSSEVLEASMSHLSVQQQEDRQHNGRNAATTTATTTSTTTSQAGAAAALEKFLKSSAIGSQTKTANTTTTTTTDLVGQTASSSSTTTTPRVAFGLDEALRWLLLPPPHGEEGGRDEEAEEWQVGAGAGGHRGEALREVLCALLDEVWLRSGWGVA